MTVFDFVYNCFNTLAIACFLIVIVKTVIDRKYPMKMAGVFCWVAWVPNLILAAIHYSGILK